MSITDKFRTVSQSIDHWAILIRKAELESRDVFGHHRISNRSYAMDLYYGSELTFYDVQTGEQILYEY
jgi:hypothetical protein